ncbi:MAG: Alpha N-terminal protein methyltransferase 1 [Sclerophora amabilis]|nr:MAG: Alpha N-terminal protein methyltransferase 1 [Sclerophora amabilis]
MAETTEAPDASIDHEAALSYWSSISSDVSGMLGGFPQISRVDLQGSANFLAKLRRQSSGSEPPRRGVDCGAGIGRVTEGFLSNACEVVDVVEPVAKFTQEIRCGDAFKQLREQGKVGELFNEGLETWRPEGDVYDLMWNQWCLGHLTDSQLVAYLEECGKALRVGGWIIVKENMCTDPEGNDVFDKVDSSVTRTDKKFRRLFREAGLRLVRTELQTGFPRALGLYPVRFYALRPMTSKA